MPFRLKGLPAELRLKIYPHFHSLAIRHDNQLPALLLALAPDPILFAEAKEVYQRINFCLSAPKGNTPQELTFKAMRMKQLLRIRHFKLVCQPRILDPNSQLYDGEVPPGLTLKAHKILLYNNFESITIVLESKCWFQAQALLGYLCVASRPGVTRIVLRLGKAHMDVKKIFDLMLKLEGICSQVIQDKSATNRDSQESVWVWEKQDGTPFRGSFLAVT